MTDAGRLKRYDDLLSAYFPPDFKDWHQNSRDEWPEITVMALRGRDDEIERLETDRLYNDEEYSNLRLRIQRAVDGTVKLREEIAGCERQIKRQAETIRDQSERMRAAQSKVAKIYVTYGHVFHDHVKEADPLDMLDEAVEILEQKTDKPAIGGEEEK